MTVPDRAVLAPSPVLDPRRWWALALLCGAFFMVVPDASIVIVALPSFEADLGFSEQGLQWVVSAYAVTFAVLLLLGVRGRPARMAPRIDGRHRVFHRRFAALRAGLALLLPGRPRTATHERLGPVPVAVTGAGE